MDSARIGLGLGLTIWQKLAGGLVPVDSQWSPNSPSDSERSPMGKVGECKDLQFLRIMHETQVTADCDKIEQFRLYITPDSPAEEWYANMGSIIKAWTTFESDFRSRFPRVQKAKKTGAELEREMLKMELKADELDKTELYGGVEVEAYKVHAKKLLEMVIRAKIDSRTANIVHV